MNLSNIKTKDQFYEFADIWYQRVHQLRYIWTSEQYPESKRIKAHILFLIMVSRVLKLSQIAFKFNQPKPKNK